MTIKRISPGPRMSAVVVHNGIAYVSGQVPNKTAAAGSVKDQTAEVLSIIDGLLAEAGTDKTKLLTTTIYLTDIGTFNDMNAAWEAWVSPEGKPARATVEAKLANPSYKVEIVVSAAV